ncbi:MAG: threo-3-hydroxy-L-aspartate ammonia-lyase [Rhodothermales bacterium]|nr:threo-3-hydroxy-L-aspartate ammonia-lyase [Rhodothermales bacterium]MBO6780733.1 threo-3-hydroxy-L-aspartate ammonia-lyase [Rhodothermales bacterium]
MTGKNDSVAEAIHAVTHADVVAAAERIAGVAHRTPVMRSRHLDQEVGARLHLKCENLQRTGAFKFRGAYNALSRLSHVDRARGVLTYSSGNHAQAVALAGRLTGTPATIIMPEDAPSVKLRATAGYGAEIITYDRSRVTRETLAAELSQDRGLPIVPPYDHPDIVAGQGTAGLELMRAVPDLDVLLVCCGGGGLLSGCALAAKGINPHVRVVGVEPENADDATRSFATGTLHTVENPDTIADGARTPFLGTVTFPLVMQHVDAMVTVPDSALIDTMRFVWERMKLIIEPTGALALAAARTGAYDVRGARVGAIISGGNVDIRTAATWMYGNG